MGTIHRTTMTPSKLELLRRWLPGRPWYAGSGVPPVLTKVGGFRLDDPAGEVGVEFMLVRDDAGESPTTYHVPMTYRAQPLPDASAALVGTAEHGVLGPRWVYDGTRDPVLVATLLALVGGDARPQHQSRSDTPDPSVTVRGRRPRGLVAASFDTHDEPDRTTIGVVLGGAAPGGPPVTIRVARVLTAPAPPSAAAGTTDDRSWVEVPWPGPDGDAGRTAVVAVEWS